MRGVGLVGIAAIAACAFAPRPPESPARISKLVLPIQRLELSNGLRIVILPDPKASEVQVTMRYRVGSVDDPPEHPGMAHLVEHLMFQQVLGAKTVFARLADDATSFNGMTSFDATTYYARAHPSRLDELLSIDAIRLGVRCASISDAVFAREREVVINEVRLRDEATEALTALHAGVYPEGHPYRRPKGGSEQTVATITREQACAFADSHYVPQNAVLVVSGAVTAPGVESALTRLFGRIPKRTPAPAVAVPPLDPAPRRLEVPAPIDSDALMLVWPLPSDPFEQARIRTLAHAAVGAINSKVKGFVAALQLGDERAPSLVVVVFPAKDESVADALDAAKRGLDRAPSAFEQTGLIADLVLNEYKQLSIYQAYAGLEDGSDRDIRIATHVLAGRDPSAAIRAELAGLNELSGSIAAAVTTQTFEWRRATIVTLKASAGKKRGHTTKLEAAIHDEGLRRDPDPADAHHPATAPPLRPLDAMRTRQLANGLKVVLLPLTSTPTVEARLVFGAGTADEPAEKRGVALVAARTLQFDLHYLDDWLRFAGSSASDVEVGTDRTTFSVRGVDMHLDLMLAGLRRWVRDGVYLGYTRRVVRSLRDDDKKTDDEGALGDAWRTALYGGGHPYVEAGILRHASTTLTTDDAAQFRAMHFTPDNATLVIAGGFDPALADRWIDYLFADWQGKRVAPVSRRPASQPASIAAAEDTELVHLGIVIPATAGDRATRLVAASMLDEIAQDVRHQLGASYTFTGELLEKRLATSYGLIGSVEAQRVRDAMELLKTRIAALRTNEVAAARAFVSARGRVLSQLGSLSGRAADLAWRVEMDVALERPVLSDRQTALAVQALTIESMTATLAELDLSRAVMFARGPKDDVDAAFAVLGRTPSYIHADPAQQPDRERTAAAERDDDAEPLITPKDVSEALTEHRAPLMLSFATAYTAGHESGQDATGFTATGEVAIGITGGSSAGLSLSIGRLDSRYPPDPLTPDHTMPSVLVPIDANIFIQATAYDRLWGSVFAGAHLERRAETVVSWNGGLGLGFEGGVDVLKLGRHRLGLFARLQGVLITGYGAATFGLAYRR